MELRQRNAGGWKVTGYISHRVAFGRAGDGSERVRYLVIAGVAVAASGILLYLVPHVSIGLPRVLTLVSGLMLCFLAIQGFFVSYYNGPRRITTRRAHEQLTISAPVALSIVVNTGLALSLMTAVHVEFDPDALASMDGFGRRAARLMVLTGIGVLAHELWSQRRPAGLTLDSDRIVGVRFGPRVQLLWEQLRGIDVIEGKRGKHLTLHTDTGPVRVPHRTVGGDLHAVASVIDYYLRHPDERHRLSDGLAAVEHVDAEYRAGRYRRV